MKRILLVVDVQNGFQRIPETKDNAFRIADLVESGLFDKIIATKFINRPDSPYYQWFHWERLVDQPDIELMKEVRENSDVILEKYYYNCERESFISALKECNGGALPECVFLCGTDTDCCVQINATTLFEMGIHPVVLVDYCASNGGRESHYAGLTVMKRTLGEMHLFNGLIDSKETIDRIFEKAVR